MHGPEIPWEFLMIGTRHDRPAASKFASRMKFRTIFPLLLLLVTQPALDGRDLSVWMRMGDEALAAGLWETASLHYSECLAAPGLTAEEKSRVAIRLAESWIREGRMEEALVLLGESFVSAEPEAVFWKGQALAGLGRFGAALDALQPLLENAAAPFQKETALTIANLHLALGKPDAALQTLDLLTGSPEPEIANRARLHQVEILFDLGRFSQAREKMPATAAVVPRDRPQAFYLEAQLLLAESRPADAMVIFRNLLDQPQGQSLNRRHLAAVGLAGGLLALGDSAGAASFLLTFIQENPDSPQLAALFQRLRDAMPQTPAASDAILVKLAEWITPPEFPATGFIAVSDAGAVSAWPAADTGQELLAQAMFARAYGLQRLTSAEAADEVRLLLNRLRLEFPQHPLVSMALFQKARVAFAKGEHEQAFNMLEILRAVPSSGELRGEAAFLEAKNAYSHGDQEKAASLFEAAAAELHGRAAQAARFNAAILQLVKTTGNDAVKDPALTADLLLERALSQQDPALKRDAIEEFLLLHPDHPREPEARLAAAEAAVALSVPDLSAARAQLDTLAAEPEKSAMLSAARIELVRLRIADLSGDPAAAIAAARSVLEGFPAEPAAAEAALVLGRNLFESSSYNEARMVLEKLAATDADPARAEVAWLLAARSAALVPTSQSQQEALILFDKVISLRRPLSSLAMLEKARLMIDMNRLPDAIAFLRQWYHSLPKTDPLHLPAGLLLGEAIYGQGGTNPASLTDALVVYDSLLESAQNQPGTLHRLQYLRGRTLEQIPDPKDPSRKREREAFTAYYSVLETTTPPDEWHYFELCGFRALALLERAGRWPAAAACAKKIASFNGPRAEEAASRASQIQLKFQIWED
jgi:thioredoxin-like negative regulator of GroEL